MGDAGGRQNEKRLMSLVSHGIPHPFSLFLFALQKKLENG